MREKNTLLWRHRREQGGDGAASSSAAASLPHADASWENDRSLSTFPSSSFFRFLSFGREPRRFRRGSGGGGTSRPTAAPVCLCTGTSRPSGGRQPPSHCATGKRRRRRRRRHRSGGGGGRGRMRKREGGDTRPLPARSTASYRKPRFHSTSIRMVATAPSSSSSTRTTRATPATRPCTGTGMSTGG